jgi:Ni,Fe-hydrogenase III small subunit/formate hydrogenlyase subunit 6/NADH:ubiquinone oxidoreductase subunit I
MIREFFARLRQGHRTMAFPKKEPVLSDRFRAGPKIQAALCDAGCEVCLSVCPTKALSKKDGRISVDLGRCVSCMDCRDVCPSGAVALSADYRLAVRSRGDLVGDGEVKRLAEALNAEMLKLFGRSLKIRQVSAGGCNACEADINVLGTPAFDLGRFGIQIVASPRHADALVVTGPVSANMRLALKKTYEAMPAPRIVVAVGACAISGGLFDGSAEVSRVDEVLPVDLFIPGCPPHPITILDGLLRILKRR